MALRILLFVYCSFAVYINYIFRCLHRADTDSVTNVSEVHSISIITVEVSAKISANRKHALGNQFLVWLTL
jgi:hypothetical protein